MKKSEFKKLVKEMINEVILEADSDTPYNVNAASDDDRSTNAKILNTRTANDANYNGKVQDRYQVELFIRGAMWGYKLAGKQPTSTTFKQARSAMETVIGKKVPIQLQPSAVIGVSGE